MKFEFETKGALDDIAIEVLDFLRPKDLPIWQVKEVLARAARLADNTRLN